MKSVIFCVIYAYCVTTAATVLDSLRECVSE